MRDHETPLGRRYLELEAQGKTSRERGLIEDAPKMLAEARRYAEQASDAGTRHGWRLRALEPVFGPAVRAAAEEHLERLTESAGEAVWHFERALEGIGLESSDRSAEIVHLRSRVANLERELERFRALPLDVVADAEAYFRRVRKGRPEWLRRARAACAAMPAVEPEEVPF